MQYYQWFRLNGPPFQPASPHGAVYFSPTHLEGLATLEAGLLSDLSGLTLLTGEAGTGKTTLIYSLLKRDYKRVRIANIDDPKLSFPEILRLVLTQLNLYSPGTTKLDYLSTLDHLLELHGKEERIAIIVDEAQVLSDNILEELRLLSNRGQRNDHCLQLVLVGQPELAERLKRPELRQLNQRISSRGELKPLNTEQAIKYVECKLVAQNSKCAAIFEPGALAHLLRRSDGIPRKINMLCYTAMMAAFYASDRKVNVRTAKKVAAEYHDAVSITRSRYGRQRLLMPAAIGGTALVTGLLLLAFVSQNTWSDWVLKHVPFGAAMEQTVRLVKPVKTVAQPGVRTEALRRLAKAHFKQIALKQGHPDSGAHPKAAIRVAPHPVELLASLAPRAAVPVAAKSDVTGPAAAPETRIVPSASASSAVSAAIQNQTGVPTAPEQRSQITVSYGDTLEKIAVRYFQSKSATNELVDANPQLTDINQLSVGQIIYLPLGIMPKASHDQTATARPAKSIVRAVE
jgi:type II secretory pathway predicted ATPase ExeA/LysM repeat protein